MRINLSIFTNSSIVCPGSLGNGCFANDIWRYIVPNSEPSANWKDQSFDDSNWNEGKAALDYGDNDDGTIVDQAISVYFRKTFSVEDISKLTSAIVSADYDDGFIAYLNGYEIGNIL